MKTQIKGVIFDYGGTIDTNGDHWSEVIWKGWQYADVAVSKGVFREAYVYAERELARTRHILPHHNFRDLLLIKMKIELQFLAQNNQFPPQLIDSKAEEIADFCYTQARNSVDNAIPVLSALSNHFPLVLVSNFYGNINTVLEDFKIKDFFKNVIESGVVGVRKPNPEIFRLGVKALGLTPQQVLVVGDSISKDIIPAESIGCHTAWLKGTPWNPDEVITPPQGTLTLSSLKDLLPVLLPDS